MQSTADERILTEIKKASSLVVASASQKVLDKQHLESILCKIIDTEDRNTKILQAYNEGYSQHTIAKHLGISQPYINRIIKKVREG